MYNLLKGLKEKREFEAQLKLKREREGEENKNAGNALKPVFNKNMYTVRNSLVITKAAIEIMKKNEKNQGIASYSLTKQEEWSLKPVINALYLIHKDLEFAKRCLSKLLLYQKFNAFEYIQMPDESEADSCHYIVEGSVEVTYSHHDLGMLAYKPNIIYVHTSGEYLGLVSAEKASEDLTSPHSIYAKEDCVLLSVDKNLFHQEIDKMKRQLEREKLRFINQNEHLFQSIDQNDKRKLLGMMIKEEHAPGKILIQQNTISEYIIFIANGRCFCRRDLFVKQAARVLTFELAILEPGAVCGTETLEPIEAKQKSVCTITTKSLVTCFKVHRINLLAIGKDAFIKRLLTDKITAPSDSELYHVGNVHLTWNHFKHNQVKLSLIENGKTNLLNQKQGLPRIFKYKSEEQINKEKWEDYITFLHGVESTTFLRKPTKRIQSAVKQSIRPQSQQYISKRPSIQVAGKRAQSSRTLSEEKTLSEYFIAYSQFRSEFLQKKMQRANSIPEKEETQASKEEDLERSTSSSSQASTITTEKILLEDFDETTT